jgi:signal transduction histidine kinase
VPSSRAGTVCECTTRWDAVPRKRDTPAVAVLCSGDVAVARTGHNEVMRRVIAGRMPVAGSVVLGALAVLQATLGQPTGAGGAGTGLQLFAVVLLALATTVPLGLLGPRAGALVIATASVISVDQAHAFTVAGLAALMIAVARLGYARAQLSAGLIVAAFLVLALVDAASGAAEVPVLLAAGAPIAAWTGSALRSRGDTVARRAESETIAGSLLEHTARGERARISRELHDVVAHHISMIAVQAETARLTTQGLSDVGVQRFAAIGDTARSALTEMRRLLGVLREDTTSEVPDRSPQPGLAQLNLLLDEARDASGTATRLIVSGRVAVLDPGVELAAYRIIQEALTNARRHAPGAAVDVELRYEASELCLRVRDNGPGPDRVATAEATARPAGDQTPGGHGLLGMRERAAAVGGTLHTGLAAGGGFFVAARLPAAARQDAA